MQPGSGEVETALRADAPVAAERVAIYPDLALAVGAHVEKGVGGFADGEGTAIERRAFAGCLLREMRRRRIGEGQRVVLPAGEGLAGKGDTVRDARLFGAQHRGEVHAAGVLDQDVEALLLASNGDGHGHLADPA